MDEFGIKKRKKTTLRNKKISFEGGTKATANYMDGWLQLQRYMLMSSEIISIDMYTDEFIKFKDGEDECNSLIKKENTVEDNEQNCITNEKCRFYKNSNMCADKTRFKKLEENSVIYGINGLKYIILKKIEHKIDGLEFTFTCAFFLCERYKAIYISFNVYELEIINFLNIPNIENFFDSIIDTLMIYNTMIYNTYQIILCGHSLGCAMSLYLYYKFVKTDVSIDYNVCVFVSGQYMWIPTNNNDLVKFYINKHTNIFVFINSFVYDLLNTVYVDDYYSKPPTIYKKGLTFTVYPHVIYVTDTTIEYFPSDITKEGGQNKVHVFESIDKINTGVKIYYRDGYHPWHRFRYKLSNFLIQILYYLNNNITLNHTNEYGKKFTDFEILNAVLDSKNQTAVLDSKKPTAVLDSENPTAVLDSKKPTAVLDSKKPTAVNMFLSKLSSWFL